MLMASVGLPLTIGFVGEFLVLLGFYKVSALGTILAGTTIIIGSVYMLALFKKSFFGPVRHKKNLGLKDLDTRELSALIPLVLITIWLGVYPNPVLGPIDNSAKKILVDMEKRAISPATREAIILSKKEAN